MRTVPKIRIRPCNDAPLNPHGEFVLYWMIAYRRTKWNYSLQRAVDWSRQLHKPLVILEALRNGYRWASDRLHRFILDGMVDNAEQLSRYNVLYYPYVEGKRGEGKGLLTALSKRACVIVTDDFPDFFLPRMVDTAGEKVKALLESVDSNGLLPMRAAERVYPTAYAFRRYLQKSLPSLLNERPKQNPLRGADLPKPGPFPPEILKRWPPASKALLEGDPKALQSIPIDHHVGPVALRGGSKAAQKVMRRFVGKQLPLYAANRNHPDEQATSGLSPYVHFGHISVHQVFHQIMKGEAWSLECLSDRATGGREGWWGVNQYTEAFLDQMVTWRELGFNMCWQRDDYDRYESLPDWALKTLKDHEGDSRTYDYSLEAFEKGSTHDPLWNAAQRQLTSEGSIHNYLRMLWGKKILEWTANPRDALDVMKELNNKYALDGRDPNSYSGIFWVLGRYDRPWGPERPIFGKVRYMRSKNTLKKLRMKRYLTLFGASFDEKE